MAVRTQIADSAGIFFITFTCGDWLPLFEITNGYDIVYNWFDFLRSKNHDTVGYVIMPNHLHSLLVFTENDKGVNKIVSDGKRFMAYELIKRLENFGRKDILFKLAANVSKSDRKRGKLHQVFEPSFDCKPCYNEWFIWEKLNYMHKNPVAGKWELANSPEEYIHSSAKFYASQQQGNYRVTNFREVLDRFLTSPH